MVPLLSCRHRGERGLLSGVDMDEDQVNTSWTFQGGTTTWTDDGPHVATTHVGESVTHARGKPDER